MAKKKEVHAVALGKLVCGINHLPPGHTTVSAAWAVNHKKDQRKVTCPGCEDGMKHLFTKTVRKWFKAVAVPPQGRKKRHI